MCLPICSSYYLNNHFPTRTVLFFNKTHIYIGFYNYSFVHFKNVKTCYADFSHQHLRNWEKKVKKQALKNNQVI